MQTLHNFDMSDPIHAEIVDLIERGVVEYGYSEDGELLMFLTEEGDKLAEQV